VQAIGWVATRVEELKRIGRDFVCSAESAFALVPTAGAAAAALLLLSLNSLDAPTTSPVSATRLFTSPNATASVAFFWADERQPVQTLGIEPAISILLAAIAFGLGVRLRRLSSAAALFSALVRALME
jgi:hypothetical protein